MITLHDVTKIYTVSKEVTVPAVRNVDLHVNQGEFVIITGRSGSGKTTLLNLVAGLTRPTLGEVRFDDVEVWKLPDREQSLLRNQRIGFVFQFPSLLPTLTSLENVMLPAMFGLSSDNEEDAVRTRAEELMVQVGLGDKLNAYPRQLSGGQQQRVVIARALMNEPELLLADEPTSDLDEQTELEIMALFQQIHAQTGITAMLVTHSADLGHYGTRSIQMAAGQIVNGIGSMQEEIH